jgi:energy-coupling factor transporter ATP-binding protein EcfA2
MNHSMYRGEIRDSIIRDLIEKVRKQSYGSYLVSVRLERIRLFRGAQINFDFPVTALLGPNGGGKSTILGASACIYSSVLPQNIFRKSRFGDEGMDDWKLEYELIHKPANPKGTVKAEVTFTNNKWSRTGTFPRDIKIFGIDRTLPVIENPKFALRKKLSIHGNPRGKMSISSEEIGNIDHIKREAERVLGRSLEDFQLFEVTYTIRKTKSRPRRQKIIKRELLEDGTELVVRTNPEKVLGESSFSVKQLIYIGSYGGNRYSEFNFGSGEASVIRMVADIESQPDGSLVLIEEIENGLHPLAVRRMVEYLIDVSKRKNIQCIFTTHSDYALAPLPSEAIWASVDGRLQQGKLSIEVLRALSGRIDKRLAIFVEDEFTKVWVESVIRERLRDNLEEIGTYPVYGDGNAVRTHLGHISNPATPFPSLCFIDGDSKQIENDDALIFRLPGEMPELTIFNSVINNLEDNVALLTIACQRPLDKQNQVAEGIRNISHTNRDPHLLFSQLGMKLGFIPEAIVRGAFLTVWIQENPREVEEIVTPIKRALDSLPK